MVGTEKIKIGSMKASKEVAEMLTKIGMRPNERVSQKDIEKEWDEGAAEKGANELLKEVNELLLEIVQLASRCDFLSGGSGTHEYFNNLKKIFNSWKNVKPESVIQKIKAYDLSTEKVFIEIVDLNELDKDIFIIKKINLEASKVDKILDNLDTSLDNIFELLKVMGLMDMKEALKEIKNNLQELDKSSKTVLNFFEGWSAYITYMDIRAAYLRTNKSSGRVAKKVLELMREGKARGKSMEETQEELDNFILSQEEKINKYIDRVGFYLNQFKYFASNLKIDKDANKINDFNEKLKALILEMHKKEYKFDMQSMFYKSFYPPLDDEEEDPVKYNRIVVTEFYQRLLDLGFKKDYIFKLIKALDGIGVNEKVFLNENSFFNGYFSDFMEEKPELIKSIPAEDMARLIVGDLHAVQRLINKDKDIIKYFLQYNYDATFNSYLIKNLRIKKEKKEDHRDTIKEIDSLFENKVQYFYQPSLELLAREHLARKERDKNFEKEIPSLEKMQEEVKKIILNIKKELIKFTTNDTNTAVFIDFWSKFGGGLSDTHRTENSWNFLKFYQDNVDPINLNLLRRGKLNKYGKWIRSSSEKFCFNELNKRILEQTDISSDEKLYSQIIKFEKIKLIFHNNGYDNLLEQFEDLIVSMLKSKWDLSQDIVNKLINIGLNRKIDENMSDPEKNKTLMGIASHIGLNLDTFRNNLTEIRQILVNGQPIPMSMKEKIYKVDNDLNNLLNGELILEYGDEAEIKVPELFELNYNIGEDLRFQVLPYKSIEHFYVGAATQCCQKAGGAGQKSMIDSFINGKAGVVVLRKGKEILSQSYFHYAEGEGGRGYILDNVEWNERLVKAYKIDLENLYANLAIKVKSDTGVDYFKCGMGLNKLNNSKFNQEEMREDPRDFHPAQDNVYTDFSEDRHLNLLDPVFKITPVTMKKSADRKIRDIMKIAGEFYEMVRGFG